MTNQTLIQIKCLICHECWPPLYTAVTNDNKVEYSGIVLSPERFACWIGEQELDLTPVEFRMLHALISQPGRVYSRESLMNSSYLDDRIVSDRTIDSHIKNLRKKISKATGDDEIIHSIYGVGYKIE